MGFIFRSISVYNQLPKRVCHTEYDIGTVIAACAPGGIFVDHDTMICERGVGGAVNGGPGIIWYCGLDGVKTCTYKDEVEVCEIK